MKLSILLSRISCFIMEIAGSGIFCTPTVLYIEQRSVSKNCIFILISSIGAAFPHAHLLLRSCQNMMHRKMPEHSPAAGSSSQIFFLYFASSFFGLFLFFITQEVIVLHVIRVSSSELGLCNSPGFINSRWE